MAIINGDSSSTTLGLDQAVSVSSSSSSQTSTSSSKKGSHAGLIAGVVIAVVVVFIAVAALFLWHRRRRVISARHVSVKKLEEFNIDSDKPTTLSPSKKVSTTSLRSDTSKQISPWTNDNVTGSLSRSTLDVTYRSGGESSTRHLLHPRTPTSRSPISSTNHGSRGRLTLDIPDRISFASSARSREKRKDQGSDREHPYYESDDPHSHGLFHLQGRHRHRRHAPHHHHHHHHRHENNSHTVRTSDGRIKTIRLPPLRPKSRPSSSHDDQMHPHQERRRRRRKREARGSRIFRAVFFAKAGSSNSGSAYAPSTVLTSEISERPTTNLSPVPEAPPPIPPSRSHSPLPQRTLQLQIANPEDI